MNRKLMWGVLVIGLLLIVAPFAMGLPGRAADGEQMIDAWSEHAPNVRDAVLETFVRSPLDVERTLPNMRYGDLLVGSLGHGQVGYNRPFAGAGHYRTCIEGLYLCGSCCHPGGNITGLPGYNCAQVLGADLRLSVPGLPVR